MSKKTKPAHPAPVAPTEQREFMRVTTRHPAIQEFDACLADATRLATRLQTWLRENDLPEPTVATLGLSVVFMNDEDTGTWAGRVLEACRGLAWAADAATSFVNGVVMPDALPKFDAAQAERYRPGE